MTENIYLREQLIIFVLSKIIIDYRKRINEIKYLYLCKVINFPFVNTTENKKLSVIEVSLNPKRGRYHHLAAKCIAKYVISLLDRPCPAELDRR